MYCHLFFLSYTSIKVHFHLHVQNHHVLHFSLNSIQCPKLSSVFHSLLPKLPFAHLAITQCYRLQKRSKKKKKNQIPKVQFSMSSQLINYWLWCKSLQNQIMHVHLELWRHLNVHVHILSVLVAVSAFAFCQLLFVQYSVEHCVCFLSSVAKCFF